MSSEIELHEINTTALVVTVCYTVTDNETTTDVVKHQISRAALAEYVEANELNTVGFTNYKMVNLECDGEDEYKTNPEEYLTAHPEKVILAYLTANLS
jgi:hypothetical protein